MKTCRTQIGGLLRGFIMCHKYKHHMALKRYVHCIFGQNKKKKINVLMSCHYSFKTECMHIMKWEMDDFTNSIESINEQSHIRTKLTTVHFF